MAFAQISNAIGKSRVSAWLGVLGLFALASATQVATYGALSLFHLGAHAVPKAVTDLAIQLWFLAPATLAALASIRVLRANLIGVGGNLRAWAVMSVALLALFSIYLGVFVAFNIWGS